ncbi:hypothetical protein PFISCL1PPCAC_14619, partial [Pristionchus fissidentatus]
RPPMNIENEEAHLKLELLRAQIELAKTQQIAAESSMHSQRELVKTQQMAAEKSIQANTAMIMVMDRLMSRLEEKKDEQPEQSAMTNLITIMKEMVKK